MFKCRPIITECKSSLVRLLREEISSRTLDSGVERSDLKDHGGSPVAQQAAREFT